MLQPQRQQAPALSDAERLGRELMDGMSALLGVIERETDLVRAGQIREAMALEKQKVEASQRYLNALGRIQTEQRTIARDAPNLLESLHRHHDVFRSMLQVNLTVLATAHAVSEGIVRGVNGEIQRRNMPQTYTASGVRAAPGARHAAPLAVSRSL